MQKLKFEKIIIGGDLQSLVYSFVEGIPILLYQPVIPFQYETTPGGINKKLLWEKLSFTLSFCGLNPFADKVSSYRIDEETGNIVVIGKVPFKSEIEVEEKIKISKQPEDKKYIVYDHFSVKKHESQVNKGCISDELIKDIFLYKQKKTQYGIAKTILTEEQLKSEMYSETYIRFRIIDVLKSWGVKGKPIFGNPTNFKIDMKDRQYQIDNSLIEDKIIDNMLLSKNKYVQNMIQVFGNPYEQ